MNDILHLLQQYNYLFLFPLAIVGGVITAIVCGFLISLHQLSFVPVLAILLAADLTGDTLFYMLGRWGMNFLQRHGYRIGITKEKLDKAADFFNLHHRKAVYFSKMAMAIGIVGLIAAGCLRVNFWRYLLICLTVTFFRSIILLIVGYFFGNAYDQIAKALNVYVAWFTVAVLLVAVLWGISLYKKRNEKKQAV